MSGDLCFMLKSYDHAILQDLGRAPATLQAVQVADVCGCLPGRLTEVPDAEQTYIQVAMKGHPTWVRPPPPQARLAWWATKFPQVPF